MGEWITKLSEYSAVELFFFNDIKITVGSVLTFVVAVLVTTVIATLSRRGFVRALSKREMEDRGRILSLGKLIYYAVYAGGLITAFNMIGLNMSSLLAAGAVFGVAIGFAMQTVVQNFVSGIILMVENSVRPGDIVELEGKLARVEEIRIRSTIVRTLLDEEMIVPNSILVSNSLKNLTMTDKSYRLLVIVGVHYDSDLGVVKETLEGAAAACAKETRVQLREFGSSSVDFSVSVWIDDPWNRFHMQSTLLFEIWNRFHESGIVIAFPQLDVHFDREIDWSAKEAA